MACLFFYCLCKYKYHLHRKVEKWLVPQYKILYCFWLLIGWESKTHTSSHKLNTVLIVIELNYLVEEIQKWSSIRALKSIELITVINLTPQNPSDKLVVKGFLMHEGCEGAGFS